jgi:hypothetical protein
MKNFDPSRAVAVDERAESGELDDFLERIETRAKSLRTQIITDAFKELASIAKQERGQLLRTATKELSDLLEVGMEDISSKLDSKIGGLGKKIDAATSDHDHIRTKVDDICVCTHNIQRLLKDHGGNATQEITDASRSVLEAVRSLTATVQASNAAANAQRADENSALAKQLLAAIAACKPAQVNAAPRGWSCRVERGDSGKISNLHFTATE